MGKALESLDTFGRINAHLSSLELNEKVRKNSHWDLQLRIIHFSWCSYQLSVTPSLEEKTHTLVLSVVYQKLSGEVR